MTSRQKVLAILERRHTGIPAFWTGNPKPETMEIYLKESGTASAEELFAELDDDARWIPADWGYRHPEGRPPFDPLGGHQRESLNQTGVFGETEDIAEVDKYPWPNPDYLDFTDVYKAIEQHPEKSVWTGMWSPFFHDVADHFGMDNYFMAMYLRPEIVEAVTERILEYYEEANRRFFAGLGDRADTFFFGNDFGTQLDLLISPEMFERFVLPGMKRLIAIAKAHGKKVLLHSCGSIYRVIPLLIDAGVDGLHPLQARARGMEASSLAKEYGGCIAFVGGVDTQDLLVNGTPEQVAADVRRLREAFGANFVVSPSHEALLPNVPLANVRAMAAAAKA